MKAIYFLGVIFGCAAIFHAVFAQRQPYATVQFLLGGIIVWIAKILLETEKTL